MSKQLTFSSAIAVLGMALFAVSNSVGTAQPGANAQASALHTGLTAAR